MRCALLVSVTLVAQYLSAALVGQRLLGAQRATGEHGGPRGALRATLFTLATGVGALVVLALFAVLVT